MDLSNQEEHFYVDGNQYFADFLIALDGASLSIDLETYMFDIDILGQRVIATLAAAVRRGVKVRVIIDGIGSSASEELVNLLSTCGVLVKVYHPLPWRLRLYKSSIKQGGFFERFYHFLSRINKRDHRKMCLIDRKQLWTGSYNISAKHLSVQSGGSGWHDMGVSVIADFAGQLAETYDTFWHAKMYYLRTSPRSLKNANKRSLRRYLSNLLPASRIRKNRFIIEKITAAQQRIWIVTPYFAPANAILRALHCARSRGVDVRLIVPSCSDVFFFPLLTSSYYADLLKIGVRIYEFNEGFLHAKAMICDSFYLVGSTNLDHRSFWHDLELDIVLQSPQSQAAMQADFLNKFGESHELVDFNASTNRWYATLGLLPRLLRYWM